MPTREGSSADKLVRLCGSGGTAGCLFSMQTSRTQNTPQSTPSLYSNSTTPFLACAHAPMVRRHGPCTVECFAALTTEQPVGSLTICRRLPSLFSPRDTSSRANIYVYFDVYLHRYIRSTRSSVKYFPIRSCVVAAWRTKQGERCCHRSEHLSRLEQRAPGGHGPRQGL